MNEGEAVAKLEVKGSSKSLTVKNAVTAVTPDGVTATTLTIGDLATGHTVIVGTEEAPIPKSGYIVTVTEKGKEPQRCILTEEDLSAANVTDESVTQGELWENANDHLLLPAIPINVNSSTE